MKRFSAAVILSMFFALTLVTCGRDSTESNNNTLSTDRANCVNTLALGPTLPTPVISPPSGNYVAPFEATCGTSDTYGFLRYTLDGSVVSTSSPMYDAPVFISNDTTFRCRTYDVCGNYSEMAEAVYVFDDSGGPTPTPTPSVSPTPTVRPTTGPGTPTPTPTPGGGEVWNFIRIQVSLLLDTQETIRVQNGIMDLIHNWGNRPEDPYVRLTAMNGTVRIVDPWMLNPFHVEGGISCNWPGGCVSTPLDLRISDRAEGSVGFILPSSVRLLVGRGSVQWVDQNHVTIFDSASGQDGYWIAFDYWYQPR